MNASLPKCVQAGEEFFHTIDEGFREKFTFLSEEFPLAVFTQSFRQATADEIPLHWHDELQMTWVRSGELEYCVNGEHFRLGGDALLFVKNHCLHSSKTIGGDVHTLCINFAPEIFHPVVLKNYVRPLLADDTFSYALLPLDSRQLGALERLSGFGEEPLSYFAAHNFLSESFEEILRRHKSVTDAANYEEMRLLQRMLDLIHTHYMDALSVKEIAAAAGVGKNRCTAIFKKYTNQPPAKYLVFYRLHLAKGRIVHSDAPISVIAQDVGYNQLSHFIEQFRVLYGFAPLQYRKKFGVAGKQG